MKKTKTDTNTTIINANGETLGHLAVRAADLLRGKNKPDYLPYKVSKQKVTVYNTDKIKVTGKKLKDKIYYHHTGHPGGIKEEPLERIMARDSRVAVRRAVYGMLPKNKLRDDFINKLTLYRGEIRK